MPISTDLTPLMERARVLRLKQDHLSRYSGVNVAIISRGLNYGTYVERADFLKIERFIDAAEELARRAGAPLDWKDFSSIDRLLKAYEEEKVNPPALPSRSDWQLLTFVNNPSMTPVAIAQHLGISLTALSQQLADASKRFDYSANKISARNADIARLSAGSVGFADEKLKQL